MRAKVTIKRVGGYDPEAVRAAATMSEHEHDPVEDVRRAVAVELAELCSEQLQELGHDGEVVEEIERELVRMFTRAGSPLEPLEAACEEALREELAQVTRERDEAREELAAIERTRIAAREILAMRWTGPTPADEARACPAELGPSEARR